MTIRMSNRRAALDVAGTVARIYGDTEPAFRLEQLAAQIGGPKAYANSRNLLPIRSLCGGSLVITPIECQACGFAFSA